MTYLDDNWDTVQGTADLACSTFGIELISDQEHVWIDF
jgi:hypothetical protein